MSLPTAEYPDTVRVFFYGYYALKPPTTRNTMPPKTHLDIDGTKVVIITPNGRHTLASVITEATKDLGATMDELRAESNGNVSLAFNNTYFPKSNELDGPARSMMNYKKAAAQANIYKALLDLGLTAEDITFSSGFVGRNNEWVPAARIFFNKPGAQRGQSIMSEVETLEAKYMEVKPDAIDALLNIKTKLEGKDAMYLGWLKGQVKTAEVSAATREVIDEVHQAVPESDEIPDTSNV